MLMNAARDVWEALFLRLFGKSSLSTVGLWANIKTYAVSLSIAEIFPQRIINVT